MAKKIKTGYQSPVGGVPPGWTLFAVLEAAWEDGGRLSAAGKELDSKEVDAADAGRDDAGEDEPNTEAGGREIGAAEETAGAELAGGVCGRKTPGVNQSRSTSPLMPSTRPVSLY